MKSQLDATSHDSLSAAEVGMIFEHYSQLDSDLKDRLQSPTVAHVSQALAVDPQEIQVILQSIRNRTQNPVVPTEMKARKILPYALALGLFVVGAAVGTYISWPSAEQKETAEKWAVKRAIDRGEVVKVNSPVGELSRKLEPYYLPTGMSITVNGAKVRGTADRTMSLSRSSLEHYLFGEILAMIGTYTPASGATSNRTVNMEEIAKQLYGPDASPFWKNVDLTVSYYIPNKGSSSHHRTVKTVDIEHPEVSPFVRKQLEHQVRKIANELSFEFKKWEQKSP